MAYNSYRAGSSTSATGYQETEFKNSQLTNPFNIDRTVRNKTEIDRATTSQASGFPMQTDRCLEDFQNSIDQEVEQKLMGDAVLTGNGINDQRVLEQSNPNYFFINKKDFNSPNLFQLNLIKPFGRSKMRTFVKNVSGEPEGLEKIKGKFIAKEPVSSQITNPYSKQVINWNHTGRQEQYTNRHVEQFNVTNEKWEKNKILKKPVYVNKSWI